MATKRPALSAILGTGKPIEDTPKPVSKPEAQSAPKMAPEQPVGPEHEAAPQKRKSGRPKKATSRRSAGHVQLNILLPGNLRKRAKIKALKEEIDMSEVIETLLEDWLNR